MGKSLLDLIIPSCMHDQVRAEMRRMFDTGEAIPAGELRLRRKDGSMVDVFSSHAFVEVPGQPPEMFCIDVDISSRKAAEEEARYLAFYDARRALSACLRSVMSRARKTTPSRPFTRASRAWTRPSK